jgi:hypothetical protein
VPRKLTKRRRYVRNLRKWARKNFIDCLMQRSGGTCELCGTAVVVMKRIPVRRRLQETRDGFLVFLSEQGEKLTLQLATIEHMEGLKSDEDNVLCRIQLACWQCNQKRNNQNGGIRTESAS